MTKRNAGIGGSGDATAEELIEFLVSVPGKARLTLKEWGASGEGYGEVEAGWKVEAFW